MGLNGNLREVFEPMGRASESEIDPLSYYQLVVDINILMKKELEKRFRGLGDKVREKMNVAFAFGTPGSDGRQEAGSVASKYEGIIITTDDVDLNKLEKTIKDIVDEAAPGRISHFEAKGPRSTLMHYRGDPKRAQPSRVAELRQFLGFGSHQDIIENAKLKLGQELIDMPARDFDRQIVGLKRSAAKTAAEGKNTIAGVDAVHFDLENGLVFFNPDAYQLSFKIGPLRLVQSTLLVETAKHMRKARKPDFLQSLHSGIVNRLDQLADDKMLSLGRRLVTELQEHYAFFLKQYHRSETAYTRSHGKDTALQLSPEDTDEIARRLAALQELTSALKIEKQPALPKTKK